MGIDHETERPAEQQAAAGSSGTPDAGQPAADDPVTANGEPAAEGPSEEWLANQRKAAEKIRAMFKS